MRPHLPHITYIHIYITITTAMMLAHITAHTHVHLYACTYVSEFPLSIYIQLLYGFRDAAAPNNFQLIRFSTTDTHTATYTYTYTYLHAYICVFECTSNSRQSAGSWGVRGCHLTNLNNMNATIIIRGCHVCVYVCVCICACKYMIRQLHLQIFN